MHPVAAAIRLVCFVGIVLPSIYIPVYRFENEHLGTIIDLIIYSSGALLKCSRSLRYITGHRLYSFFFESK